jgi:N-acetyl-anhydromuramyl-L-alanine amidase AmpD
MNRLIPEDIIKVEFPPDQYVQKEYKKKQIVLHHSAGWDNAAGMFDYWRSNTERVGTCVGIDDLGRIFQGFSSRYYAWHVNIGSGGNKLPAIFAKYKTAGNSLAIEQQSIGIEICNWGGLTLGEDGGFHTYVSKPTKPIRVPENKVIEYPNGFRGFHYFERYTDKEIESLGKLLYYWCDNYNIDKSYHPEMWDVSEGAISGQQGIWTHASYRTDKSDCHPQPELIQMLQSL